MLLGRFLSSAMAYLVHVNLESLAVFRGFHVTAFFHLYFVEL